MKCYESAKAGKAMDTFTEYLTQKSFDSPNKSSDHGVGRIVDALAYRAKRYY